MVSPLFDVGLSVAWVLVLLASGYRYRTGAISWRRFLLIGGTGAAWLAYSVLQLTDGTPVSLTGTAELAVLGLSGLLLVVGVAAMYRSWTLRTAL